MPSTYIPALRFHFLTYYYDFLIRLLLPEKLFKNALIDAALLSTNDKILDAGCGTATLSMMIAEKFPQAAVTAFDIDDEVLFIAAKKIKSENISNLKLVKITGIKLPFENETYDIAFASLLFCNLTYHHKIKMIQELNRVLKPNSKLMIAEWSESGTILAAAGFFVLQCIGGFANTSDIKNGMLISYLNQNNFKVEELKMFNTLFGTIRIYSALKK